MSNLPLKLSQAFDEKVGKIVLIKGDKTNEKQNYIVKRNDTSPANDQNLAACKFCFICTLCSCQII